MELKSTQQELAAIIRENKMTAEQDNKQLQAHEVEERARLVKYVNDIVENNETKWEALKRNQENIQETLNGNGHPEKGLVMKMVKLVWWVRLLTGVSILNVISQQGLTLESLVNLLNKLL